MGPEAKPTGKRVDASSLFAPAPLPDGLALRNDPAALAAGCRAALAFLDRHPEAASSGLFAELGVAPARFRATLAFVATTAEADLAAGAPSRLADPAFLAAHFELYRWTPDASAAASRGLKLRSGKIRLTRYFVPQIPGSSIRTEAQPVALYADPGESQRTRFTRAEVFDGAWLEGGEAPGGAPPLVWLGREQAHDAMMQGTVSVSTGAGPARLYNVHRHNERAYRPGVRSEGQERLWYFREVDGLYGWAVGDDKVPLQAGAAVAGDVYNLGLGGLFLLEGSEAGAGYAAVLADTGGAFQPNLFQLDWLAGAFTDRAALYSATAGLPDQARAGLLLVREAPPTP